MIKTFVEFQLTKVILRIVFFDKVELIKCIHFVAECLVALETYLCNTINGDHLPTEGSQDVHIALLRINYLKGCLALSNRNLDVTMIFKAVDDWFRYGSKRLLYEIIRGYIVI